MAEAIRVATKYKMTVKEPGIPGVLHMNEEMFAFVPDDPRSLKTLDVEFKKIRGHNFSEDGSQQALLSLIEDPDKGTRYIFEFENFTDRNSCRGFVGSVLGKLQAVPEELAGTPPAVRKRKNELLKRDRELARLHKQFVSNGILTDSEFWEPRKALLCEAEQRLGLPNAMQSAMLLCGGPSVDGGIRQMDPTIDLAADAADDYIHRPIRQVDPTIDLVADAADDYIHRPVLIHRPIRQMDPTIDLAADAADDYIYRPDHGIVQRTRNLFQDLNRHGAFVLKGGNEKSEERVAHMTELEDLQAPRNPPYVPLCIKDTREEYSLKALGGTELGTNSLGPNISKEDAYRYMEEQFSELKSRGLNNPIIRPDTALKVLNELSQNASSTRFHLGKDPENTPDRIPRQINDELMEVQRMKDEMTQIYQKLQEIQGSAQSDLKPQISLLVQPMLQAMDAAFDHDLEQQRRTA